MEPQVSIQELFFGKSIFITGATGFLGKVLLEKLLRSCPGVKDIFVLLRTNKECHNVEDRLQELLKHRAFSRVRNECPDSFLKVKALSGDVVLENLGLEECQLQKVIDVSFVFHCAANVLFDDKPKNTLNINLLGVKNVLETCRSFSKLEALVHVSTAFSFCHNQNIGENIYPEMVDPIKIIDALEWMTNEQLRVLCEWFIQGRPSLYHFSKAMAEILITNTAASLPVIIVRPSIVTASAKEPFPGWIDNYNGPSGFIAVCGKGIVRTLLVNPDVNADWVPVDVVCNTLIVAAHYLAVKSKLLQPEIKLNASSGVPIINCICPENNMITWMKVVNICLPYLIQYPSMQVYGVPGGTVTSSVARYTMCLIVSHFVPAYLIDLFCILSRKNPRMVRLYKRIHGVMDHLQLYTTHSYTFHSDNMNKLVEQMDKRDNEFPIDQRYLDWNEYTKDYVLGVRRYFLNEDDASLPEARKKMMRIYYSWLALKVASLLGILLLCRKYGSPKCCAPFLQCIPLLSVFQFLHRKVHSLVK